MRYLSSLRRASPARRAAIYERALRAIPGSYKIWHAYLTELVDTARELPVTHPACAGLNAAFERALPAGMSRMPRVWHMYASSLIHQRLLTRARRALDRALRSLTVTQHHRVWPLFLRLAALPGSPVPTALALHRRHLQFDPGHAEDLVAFLVSAGRWSDAAEQLAAAINDEGFVSAKGTTKRQLLLDLCGLLSQHPEEVSGMPVDAILRSGIRKFPDDAGVLWTCLASHYARTGLHGKARDVFEEGATTAATVKDFHMVFDAYLHLEHAMAAAELDQADTIDIQDFWLADRDGTDFTMARLERLLDRRPEMLNGLLLRQNPHDIQACHARAKIFEKDLARHVATYLEAVRRLRTVDPAKATGKKPPHTLWLALAKMYEDRGRGQGSVECARDVFQRATQQANFTAADHLAAVYCEWAHMELRQQNPERAMNIIRQATSIAAAGEPVRMKLHRCLKLWLMYLDLTKTHGSLDSTIAVYDRMHDLGLTTPLLLLDHARAALLEEHQRFEDAFRVYERGVRSFRYPHAEAIWEAYLTKFVQRHGRSRPERVREPSPPERKKAAYLAYARFEEEFGLAGRDRPGVFEVYVARAAELYGVLKARDVYSRAISGSGLPDGDARTMCVWFADLEVGLGEVARARALYVYAASFTDPEVYPEFWKRWNDFEVRHGDECTYREMLHGRRSMAAAAASAGGVVEMDGFRAAAPKRTLRGCAGRQLDGASIAQICKRTRLL